MSSLGEGLLERGREEGREQGMLQTISAVVKHCGLSVDDVLDCLDLSEEKRERYKLKLNQMEDK